MHQRQGNSNDSGALLHTATNMYENVRCSFTYMNKKYIQIHDGEYKDMHTLPMTVSHINVEICM